MLGPTIQWWTVSGLVIDIAGFNIIAFEVYHNFWKKYRSDFFLAAAKSTRDQLADIEVDENDFASKLSNMDQKIAWRINRWAWYRLRLRDFREYGRWFVAEPDFEEQADIFEQESEDILNKKIRYKYAVIGFVLVNLGFFLQIVGSLST